MGYGAYVKAQICFCLFCFHCTEWTASRTMFGYRRFFGNPSQIFIDENHLLYGEHDESRPTGFIRIKQQASATASESRCCFSDVSITLYEACSSALDRSTQHWYARAFQQSPHRKKLVMSGRSSENLSSLRNELIAAHTARSLFGLIS